MTHFDCNCAGCSEMETMLSRDPREILREAREWLRSWDSFAFGILLSAELKAQGVTLYPPKFLPQSNTRDFGADYDGPTLTRYRYKYA